VSARNATPARPVHAGAAPAWRRVLSQGAFEARTILRNGEQLLVGAHMLGAGLLTATMAWTILSLRVRPGVVPRV